MRSAYLLFLFFIAYSSALAQDGDFIFGVVNMAHLDQTSYPKDSTADAFVIKEFGNAYFSEREEGGIVFTYHVKIKILTNKGLEKANVSIPLRKSKDTFERIRDIEAVTSNSENNRSEITSLDPKKIYSDKVSEYYEQKKFTFPNAKVGSVIEYRYTIESPFIFNFRGWEFQSDIPKAQSDYWIKLPANYDYNVALAGFKKLDTQESEIIRECFRIQGTVAGCSFLKFGMKDIPSFIEEDYMTAARNFRSAIHFELKDIYYPNGSVKHFTKTWQDVYKELKSDEDFGSQLRRNSELFKTEILALKAKGGDQNSLAKSIFELVKNWYTWDNYYGMWAKEGLKKAHANRKGNVGDINLSLIAALQYAGLKTDPVLISTRENGIPTKLFPVLSEFNYVVAKVNLDDESYLLDATDKDLPFGTLPFRCLNKQGRAIGKDSCYWVNLAPKAKFKQLNYVDLKLDSSGNFVGKVSIKSMGYQALLNRKTIREFATADEYIKNLDEKNPTIKIKNYTISNLDSVELPLTEEFEVIAKGFDSMGNNPLLISPFLFGKITENPFKLNERTYPIDFGAEKDFTTVFQLAIPTNYQVKLLPTSVGLQLPRGEGKYAIECRTIRDNVITINQSLSINRAELTGDQYPYLKELYNKVVQSNKSNIMIAKK